jgi:hypothetical protein
MVKRRVYSKLGETIRVDTPHKVAIIAVSGKPGNPFLLVFAPGANGADGRAGTSKAG